MVRRKWTEEEDRIVLNAVKEHANNLRFAFESVSSQLDRTPTAISMRWYSVISKNTDRYSIALMCVSKNSCSINRKNCKNTTGVEESFIRRMWNLILNLFE